jgi:hypothetical protein
VNTDVPIRIPVECLESGLNDIPVIVTPIITKNIDEVYEILLEDSHDGVGD